jgi:hypothetical protein
MKHKLLCLLSAFFLSLQIGFSQQPVLPLNPNASPLFGKDIVINDIPSENQKNVAVCSAFNGWLYAAYTYDSIISSWPFTFISLLRSTDNGLSWSSFYNWPIPIPYIDFTDIDLVTTGNDLPNLKLFFGATWYDPASSTGHGFVSRFNGVTGIWEGDLWQEDLDIHNLAIASDYPYPAANSNPSSLAVIYSVSKWGKDSIICLTSSNGGMSLDKRKAIVGTSKHFHKVAISYGRSPFYSTGRYYAAWEEQENVNSTLGHIFTAHTTTNFNSNFTKPIKLDSIDPTGLNLCRNPKISCQVNNADNESANITEVVLFEKKNPIDEEYDVTGYYNLQSTTSSNFQPLDIAITTNNELQPDINFNSFDSSFMVTYFDSTTQKLPFLNKNINMLNPNTWNIISPGYNDSPALTLPHPKVQINYEQQQGINVWSAGMSSANEGAMFDAVYSTYTNISEKNHIDSSTPILAFPNPCNKILTIEFFLNRSIKITVQINNLLGQSVGSSIEEYISSGKKQMNLDVSILPPGCYLFSLRGENYFNSVKVSIIR